MEIEAGENDEFYNLSLRIFCHRLHFSLFFVTNFSVSSHQKVGKTKTAPTVAASAMRINDQDQKGTWGWLVRGDTEVVIVKDTSNKAKSSAENAFWRPPCSVIRPT